MKIKLDRERELKFNYKALSELSRVAGVNANDPAVFRFPLAPHVVSGFVWAGQLHTTKPLTLAQVEALLPLSFDFNADLGVEIINAVVEARHSAEKQNADENEKAS
jgi:hypothetical protein